MDSEALSETPEVPQAPPSTKGGPLEKIFLNDHGLRAGWRLMIYAVLVMVLATGSMTAVRFITQPVHGAFSPTLWLFQETLLFAVIFGSALIMSRMEKRPAGAYGLPVAQAFGKYFWQGWLVGLCEVTALMGLIATFGGYKFGSVVLQGGELAHWAVLWGIFFVVVGLFEEFLFRGYTQFTLGDGIGFWPAAILLSTLFGLAHLRNPGEGWVGAASVVMIGLVLAFALRRTGNLWFVVGLHASFDFGETFLYSVPNSGMLFEGHLSSATLQGKPWLTGGTVGPEGSVFSFVTMALLAVVIHVLFPAKNTKTQPS